MKKSRINFPSPIYLACSRDLLRPAINHVWFDDGFAYATDANILLRQSFNYIGLENTHLLNGKSIHQTIFQRILKHNQITITEDGIRTTEEGSTINYGYANYEGKFPDCKDILADFTHSVIEYTIIGIDHIKLAKLVKAMGLNSQLKIILPPFNTRSIQIVPFDVDKKDMIGILMPCAVNL